jgi:hypothetical protein
MSLCPIDGKMLCCHTPEERGQISEEVSRSLTQEEKHVLKHGTSEEAIALAKKNAHLPVVAGRAMPARV